MFITGLICYITCIKFIDNDPAQPFVSDTTLNVEAAVRGLSSPTSMVFISHDWGFDGKSAWRDIAERWKDETRQWLGSNFYPIYYHSERYHKLGNNPSNFTGTGGGEEQYYDVTNPNIEPILDYESSDSKYRIATYKLNYDKGRAIVIGLPSEDIITDPSSTSCQKFIKFFDDLLSDYAM